jgi:hypothetical protein
MKPGEAVEYLRKTYGVRMSVFTLYRRRREDGIPCYRVPGGMGFSRADLDNWIQSRRSA